jgi:eukaryotic-like serine/threonine-protein kinase
MSETPRPQDTQPALADLALERKLISPKQYDACRELVRKAKQIGFDTTMEEVLVKQGVLVPEQLEELKALLTLSDRGSAFGTYRLVRLLGEGGMGKVYEAVHDVMNRTVALKVMNTDQMRDKVSTERFFQEIRALAKLHHPNVVAIHDAGRVGRRYYFAMEYVEGASLKHQTDQKRRLPEHEALAVIRDTALGLAHAHERGIIHRDVKPENILIDADGTPKLTDFGLVMHQDEDHKTLTQTGLMIGSYYYVSPEQLDGARDIDGRSDIYSLGATLYYALTGQTAYGGKTPQEVVAKTLSGDWITPRRHNPHISGKTVNLVRRMMMRNRDKRYATAREVAVEIERALTPSMWLKRILVLGGTAAALVAAGIVVQKLFHLLGT